MIIIGLLVWVGVQLEAPAIFLYFAWPSYDDKASGIGR